jgi:hypothetical protein
MQYKIDRKNQDERITMERKRKPKFEMIKKDLGKDNSIQLDPIIIIILSNL